MTDKTASSEKAGQSVAVCAGADCSAAPLFPKGSYTVNEIAHSGTPYRLTQRYFRHMLHTLSSVVLSENTKDQYNQCQNINYGCTFKSLETVTDIIMCLSRVNPVPPHSARGGTETSQG